MKRNILGTAVLATILTSGVSSAYSGSPKKATATATGAQAADSRAEDTAAVKTKIMQANAGLKKIVVGANPAPHAEILNAAKGVLTSKGYELKIVEYTNYVQSNDALDSGDLDASYFQHKPYLDSFNRRNGINLVSTGVIHYEPFGIRAGKIASLEELSDGAAVLVPNDVNNEARALLLPEAQGLIKLKDGVGLEVTRNDTVESAKNLDIVKLEVAQLPRSVSDGDTTITNGSHAIEAELRVSDALTTKDSQSLVTAAYDNIVAVRRGKESGDAAKALMEALASPEAKQFMEETYEGAVVPLS